MSCPTLFLAPMEGLGDRAFRKAMLSMGGFDHACTEFLRVPCNAHVESLSKKYHSEELGTIPLAAQIMGSDPILMGDMAHALQKRRAPRIDVNCGCPSHTVTGKGAGSSLLKDPEHLHRVIHSVCQSVSIPVTAKLRSGFDDISLFQENLLAAQEAGICFLTLHPRTKKDGYGPPARWDLIAQAKSILKIPLIGNGDILSKEDALQMLQQTRCDGIMIGRGSVINPWIFQEIKSHFLQISHQRNSVDLKRFFKIFMEEMDSHLLEKGKINKLKQLAHYMFRLAPICPIQQRHIMTTPVPNAQGFLNLLMPYLYNGLKKEFLD